MTLRPGRVTRIHKHDGTGIDRSDNPFPVYKFWRKPGLIVAHRPALESGYTYQIREIYPQWGIGVSTCVKDDKPIKHPRLKFDYYVDLVKVWEDQEYIYIEDMYVDVLIYERNYYHVIDLEEFGEAVYQHNISLAEATRVMDNTQKFVDAIKRSKLSYQFWKQKYGRNYRHNRN
ncbi:DUF402 domain-containing protein [Alicyclobacillus sp. SO9]|uniref:DUF402 domain-containing protein n=1 Tax=Alicyclobacillus sp. SO9 TaxID=2665646 RepID=UPI0018E8A0F4|nr:DUF402 domain-containing protein [Alicyclobacillus sp. SO9]QQE79477.1 DUF402 domain-containing protein [Alicyclobacillus sp. SO9]